MRKITTIAASIALGGGMLLTGCELPKGPCESVPRPSQAEIADYRQGRELEQDVKVRGKWVECEWTGSRWEKDD